MGRTIALMAHVDAGKTTLSEAILFMTGRLQRVGRVDAGASALDSDPVERARGITVYAAQADFSFQGREYTLIDTPGHADFAAETGRALPIADAALLLLDGTGRAGARFLTLYRQLAQSGVPAILALTKADRPIFDARRAARDAARRLGVPVILADAPLETLVEAVAEADEALLERYLAGEYTQKDVYDAMRRLFAAHGALFAYPVSGLSGEGVRGLLEALDFLMEDRAFPENGLKAPVFQVRMDERGQRVCFVRLMAGALKPRDEVLLGEEKFKIHEIRRYLGAKYRCVEAAGPGDVAGLTGLPARAGDRIEEVSGARRILSDAGRGGPRAALRSLIRPRDARRFAALSQALGVMTEEEPMLEAAPEGQTGVQVSLAGPVQLEVLGQVLSGRFGIETTADPPRVLYRETVKAPVRGCGHYEPLRHYAEVQLALLPAPPGSGIGFESLVPVDELALNWQRLIETHVFESPHPGPLTGSALTDVTVVLLGGRAHLKHTEGGDFRQATYRAIRQAMFQAEMVLLEPWMRFEIALPLPLAGRAMSDVERLGGACDPIEALEDGFALVRGAGPVGTMMDYPLALAQYAKGEGLMTTQTAAPRPCREAQRVIAAAGYAAEADTQHPAWSVFCAKGAGYAVPWRQVPQMAHTQIPASRLRAAGIPDAP